MACFKHLLARAAGARARGSPARLGVVIVLAALAGIAAPDPAPAHPHVFIEVRVEVERDASGAIAALRHTWAFDDIVSVSEVQGLDKNGDGKYSPAELAPLAKHYETALPQIGYFTRLTAGKKVAEFTGVKDLELAYVDGVVVLDFRIPLKAPLALGDKPIALKVYDPSYYYAVSFRQKAPISFKGGGCAVTYKEAPGLDGADALRLSEADADPQKAVGLGVLFAKTALISCGPQG